MQHLIHAIATSDSAVRLFHGRGGRFAGEEHWTLDAFPPALLLTSFKPITEGELATVGGLLQGRWVALGAPHPLTWVYQCRQPSGRTDTRLMAGALPEPHIVSEAGARFMVQLLRGQNHGLFLDMAEGRRWVREFAADFRTREGRGARVLNLFAYTCAFSVAALQGGAAHVTNLDMARGALATGQQNHQLNGLHTGASFLAHDIFSSWGNITRSGPYDLVIADPPSYQKGSFVATKDYARLLRRLPQLLTPGGHALLCLNAPELGPRFLTEQVSAQAPALVFVERVANPPVFADIDEDRSLKALVFRLCPQPAPLVQQKEAA
ncbi:MAG: class I SAM-dependent methyltransferase [Proteobacteria bacterium]|nr:class I SAM-dependent methyltransferase [Pseudomonadota bacterium]MBS0495885.1 class I SAM-dependent methyltransferase [Pseudomonadota bacterium]